MDSGRRRESEYRALLQKAEVAESADEAFAGFTPKDLTPSMVGALVLKRLEGLRNKYEPVFQQTLDLLVYVNLLEHFFESGDMPSPAPFGSYGWRSVCAVSGSHSFVFFASGDSPSFIARNAGKVVEKKRT